MARPLRLEYAGALYHIMARGDGGRRVFVSAEDSKIFLALLGRVCARCGWRVHAWVLMGNHYHLLVETPEANLVAGMKWLMGVFSQGWNLRRKRRGHVFQGRYKSVLVNGEDGDGNYLRVVADYIHLNPARAGLVGWGSGKGLLDYEWSSLGAYARGRGPEWLETARVLQAFELAQNTRGRRAYVRHLVERAKDAKCRQSKESEAALRRGWYLGEEGFLERLQELARKVMHRVQPESLSGSGVREHHQREAQRLVERALEAVGLAEGITELRRLKCGDPRKALVARLLRERTTAGNAWLAQRLALGHASGVSRVVRHVSADPELTKAYEKLSKMLQCAD